MARDLSPEDIAAQESAESSITLNEAVRMNDVGAQPGPEMFEQVETTSEAVNALSRVRWPASELEAPDYRYLANELDHQDFTLTPETLERLVAYNRYVPYRDKGIVAFALRGAQLKSGHEIERASRARLQQVTPDHRHFRCIVGFYFVDDGLLTVFAGSTVPCRRAIYNYKHGGDRSNMLPTGMYTYFVWRHKSIRPALRLGHSSADPETGAAGTVLRNKNNYTIDVTDPFNLSENPPPLDNIHCSYYLNEDDYLGAYFSSWGCLTVRGRSAPSDQWKKFQQILDGVGERGRVDLLLATGKDAAIAASPSSNPASVEDRMTALRVGSRGAEVKRLQEKLGVARTGYFGPYTLDNYTGFQRTFNDSAGQGRAADGIYTKVTDAVTGWGVFSVGAPSA